jgi:hypothetical protein
VNTRSLSLNAFVGELGVDVLTTCRSLKEDIDGLSPNRHRGRALGLLPEAGETGLPKLLLLGDEESARGVLVPLVHRLTGNTTVQVEWIPVEVGRDGC